MSAEIVPMQTRIVVARTVRGHVVTIDPLLVLRARLDIRHRRDRECEVSKAA